MTWIDYQYALNLLFSEMGLIALSALVIGWMIWKASSEVMKFIIKFFLGLGAVLLAVSWLAGFWP